MVGDTPINKSVPFSFPAPSGWKAQVGAVGDLSKLDVPGGANGAEQIAAARMRQQVMLQDDVGFNISPISWDKYPTIGRNGTFVSDRQGVMSYFGDVSGKTEITISPSLAAKIEKDMGLIPGSLQEGFKVRQVTGLKSMEPVSPLEGNQYFRGPGNHLPGGAPEMVVRSISTVDSDAVTTLLKVRIGSK